MRVRFLRAAVYRAAAPYHKPGELSYVTTHYAAGEEYDLADELARRFLARKAAVEAEAVTKPEPKPAAPAAKPEAKHEPKHEPKAKPAK